MQDWILESVLLYVLVLTTRVNINRSIEIPPYATLCTYPYQMGRVRRAGGDGHKAAAGVDFDVNVNFNVNVIQRL